MKRTIALASLMIGMAALGNPAVEGNVRRVVVKEEPPAFDYWDLTEAQRASYAVHVASPSDPFGGQDTVTVDFEIRLDASRSGDGRKDRRRKVETSDYSNKSSSDDSGQIVGTLSCTYSAGIPHVSYGYIQVVEADASGSCQYTPLGGAQPEWIRWDMVLLLQVQPGNGWAGQETYSQTGLNPSWSASETTVEGIHCLNELYTNTVPVFVAVPDGFTVSNNPIAVSLAWAWIVGCPSNPFY
ncbi:MAG: hypothetical protein F4029_19375 [Gammaproteobacteria bacterium]|nr:hypothetical protein [Gammaproteobacteria bacterium]MXY56269.1 hypothetical protein [Gammaproteobacteria bacterium]MYF29951.1 hypothetical protein [Gammaproteobacteria bacterium]MYK48375.1 hypothetical protein [Gammaproteobacteria bacterium]